VHVANIVLSHCWFQR